MNARSYMLSRCHALTLLAWFAGALALPAQQQFQGLCARVKIEILQELTIERIGFEATLEVTNNDGEDPITDFFADLTFEKPPSETNASPQDAASLFFVRAPTRENINDVTGSGVIGPTRKAVVKWFIIPKIAAGGTSPNGMVYRVGCNLSGKIRGAEIPKDVLFAVSDTITVRPEPQLEITYFQPRDVQGDDPFTPEVESPISFTLGVLVKNSGYGPARKLKINSQQPKIVENRQGLLLVARLLGARVNDSPLQTANLVVDLGDIPPGQTRKGAWDMITSLSGEFTEFKASYTHASELGGDDTSVIKSLEAHFIAHEVMNDQPGRDRIKDFLTDTDRDEDIVPDALYESEGNVLPVNYLTLATNSATSVGPGGSFFVDLQADKASWGYMRLTDPGQARLRIQSIVRQDGKVLNTNNFWTNIRYTRVGNVRQNFLNIFDLVDLGPYRYTVTYAPTAADVVPPVTTMYFSGSAIPTAGKIYVSPDTQMYFLSEDQNPVSIFYSVTNGAFLPALPFRLRNPGEYPVVFYATDSSNNREANKTNILVVSAAAPALVHATISPEPLFIPGDALSIRPDRATFAFQAQPNPTRVDAILDIFQGVNAWATVRGVPSSPTANTSATLLVGGEYVDYYKYKLDSGNWSPERAQSDPIILTALSQGTHTVAVLGRSAKGTYFAESNAVQVTWVVSATAPPIAITGVPETPTRQDSATLLVGGTGVTDYRWNLNDSFYRAETPVANPLLFTGLAATQHLVRFLGKVGGVFQPTNNNTTVWWTVNPLHGSDLSALARVRTVNYSNIGSAPLYFVWDGRDDAGVVMPPGWFTIRLRLIDELGRSSFTTRLVQISELTANPVDLAGVARGPKNPHARGRWAVWQDQSQGNWNVYGQEVALPAAPIVPLTTSLLSQENPKTDGRYVVWQARQTNGNWDVFMAELGSPNPPQALTSTSTRDEVNPAIEWPWVVYQSKASSAPNAPWQLRALNLLNQDTFVVSPSTQDQLDPDIQGGRVVWQDWREVGPGEIYFRNLESDQVRRITTNTFGQYHPAIFDNWIVWQDNRHGQVDLYGFDLLRNTEIRVTATPEDETRPYLEGPWAVCEETSLGPLTANVRLVHLSSLRSVPLTRSLSQKARPALAGGRSLWLETQNNLSRVASADLPSLQTVFQNRNAIAVTEAMANYLQNAYGLLAAWQTQGVHEVTRFTALVPDVASQTANWNSGQPTGPNFNLVPGTFLWVKFDDRRVLDLGINSAGDLDLAPGINAFSYTRFPNSYSAYQLLRRLGLNNVFAVRMLDSESGKWSVAQVVNNRLVGQDFAIPGVAVLMLDMANAVNNFTP